jgi:hypothetical protein
MGRTIWATAAGARSHQKKALFYAFDGTRLTFAEEIKVILACLWEGRLIAVKHLPELFIFGYVQTPGTMYHGILQVPLASYVAVGCTGLKGLTGSGA